MPGDCRGGLAGHLAEALLAHQQESGGEGAAATSLWMGGHRQTGAAPAAMLSAQESQALCAARLRCSV